MERTHQRLSAARTSKNDGTNPPATWQRPIHGKPMERTHQRSSAARASKPDGTNPPAIRLQPAHRKIDGTNPTIGSPGKMCRPIAVWAGPGPGCRRIDETDPMGRHTDTRSALHWRGDRLAAPEDEVGLDRLAAGGADQRRDLAPVVQGMAVELGQHVGDDAPEPVALGGLVDEDPGQLQFGQAREVIRPAPPRSSCPARPHRPVGSGFGPRTWSERGREAGAAAGSPRLRAERGAHPG
jgi:hypothetical protein